MRCLECGGPLDPDAVGDICADCKADLLAKLHDSPHCLLVEDHFDWLEGEAT